MKRGLVTLLALMLLRAGGVSAQDATPEIPDGPYMAIWVSDQSEADASDEAGEHCFFSWSPIGMGWMNLDYQVIIRNEIDAIIAVHTVEPTWYESEDTGDLYCVDDTLIALPEADVYQVFLNDQWITAFTPDTLPTDPDRGLYLPIGEAPWD